MKRAAVLAGLIAPPACISCRGGVRSSSALCERCARRLSEGAAQHVRVAGTELAWAARPYDGVARELVAALKFRRLLHGAEVIAGVIDDAAPAQLLDGVIVPVPPDPVRRMRRGFDAAELIAAELARRSGLPLCLCLRRRRGPRQVGRSREERLRHPPRIRAHRPPERALLVDDVITTGATLSACARALRAAGATEVRAAAFAARGAIGWQEPGRSTRALGASRGQE